MRSLKFRAWGRDVKKFLYIELKPNAQIKDDEWRYNGYDDWEQYTGLKDKNGKDIYEGDIVDYNDDGECIGVVEYDAPEFCLNADAANWARMFLKGAPHQRVIGNIHENPELVEGGK